MSHPWSHPNAGISYLSSWIALHLSINILLGLSLHNWNDFLKCEIAICQFFCLYSANPSSKQIKDVTVSLGNSFEMWPSTSYIVIALACPLTYIISNSRRWNNDLILSRVSEVIRSETPYNFDAFWILSAITTHCPMQVYSFEDNVRLANLVGELLPALPKILKPQKLPDQKKYQFQISISLIFRFR